MSDETNPPDGEPSPGSTDWLLAQLSGGRIDSRRERREAEAALEAAGVPIPDATAEVPAAPAPEDAAAAPEDAAAAPEEPAVPAEEKPKARFSWETGTLEAVGAPDAEELRAQSADTSEASAETPAVPAPAPLVEPDSSPAIPFMWNLAPTHEPDPAVNPRVEIPEPSFDEPDFPFPSAAPLVVPRPPARPLIDAAPLDAPAPAPAPAPAEAVSAERELIDGPPAEPALPVPSAEPALPVPPAAPVADAATAAEGAAPAAEPAPARAPLPPGTTAHEFDPFAQDLFAPPVAAGTPVPSVDEFTIPDEGSSAPASVPVPAAPAATEHEPAEPGAAPEAHEITSDWGDIADMLGAHPETVDTAIVSPMPPVNEILPSFDALLPRAAAPAPAPAAAPGQAQTPPPARPARAPVEHGRERSPLNRWLLIAAAVLLAILIAVALFSLGRAIAAGNDQTPAAATHTTSPSPTTTPASPSPSPTPTSTDDQPIAGSGPLAPGQSYQWDQLRGGECIDPFTAPWAQTFDVVDCAAPHAAQLVYTAPFASDPAAPFPGEQAISSQIGLLCSKPGVIDLSAASAYSDVQVIASYPVNADQWSSGQRSYFCFVTRSSGQQFTSSIAGPGPTS